MFSLYSKGCEYAIRALTEIAHGEADQKFRAKDICRKAEIPEAYSRKTFQALVSTGFLKSIPGPGGGYSIALDPAKTTVLDVIKAVEGDGNFGGCVLGLAACNERTPCALHPVWAKLKIEMLTTLGSKTLKDLSISTLKKSSNLKGSRVKR